MLADIIANEMQEESYASYIMPIEVQLLDRLFREFDGILFFDEIHRMNVRDQHVLLSVLQDGYYQTKGGAKYQLDDLTIIGATTDPHDLIKPVYDRFQIKPHFDDYTDDELTAIARNMAAQYMVDLPEETLIAIGQASLGVPRHVEGMVKMARDMALQTGSAPSKDELLDACRITPTGLGALHIQYCRLLSKAGGTAGLDLMRQLIGLPAGALEAIEVDLIKQQMIERSSRGRVLTMRGSRLSQYGTETTPRRRKRERRPHGRPASFDGAA